MDLLETVSLSADGNRVAVGATGNDVGGTDYQHDNDGSWGGGGLPNAGHVRVFERSGGSWVQLGDDIDGEAEGDTSGRSISLSADGSRVAVGADHNQDGGYEAGHVRVFELSGGGWVQLGADIDGDAFDYSISSGAGGLDTMVSLSANGARVAVGAPGGGLRAGRVRVFELSSGGGWVQLGADINGESTWDRSGWSVSLSADGSRVAVGAISNDDGGFNAGHVRVLELSAVGWVQLGADIDGDGGSFGYSVSLSANGARVAAGASSKNIGGPDYGDDDDDDENQSYGQVRVYELSGGGWVQLGADINGEHQRDNSGCSVSLSADGSRVAVGANGNEGGIYNPWPHSRPQGYNAGHVRVFELSAGGWLQLGDDIDGEAEGNQNGRSVSLSADGARVAMGAPGARPRNRGHVRVFEWPTSSRNP